MTGKKDSLFAGMIFIVVMLGTWSFFGVQAAFSHNHLDEISSYEGEISSLTVDPLGRDAKPATWYLGKGIEAGDIYTYRICDMVLIVPESSSHCYLISLEFIDLLKGPLGDVWVVQAEIDHQDKKKFSIFQISSTTFDITTDGTSIPYADSVSRTLFWIGQFASKLDPKPLVVGKSWGDIATYTAPKTELVVRNAETPFDGKEQFDTFVLGYNLIEQSIININAELPFPIKAVIYKPTASHQNIPLQFTIELVEHTNSYYVADDFQEIFSDQNEESSSYFEDYVLLNETNIDSDYIETNEPNMATDPEDNSGSADTTYFDAINLEELFEMFLKEHFGSGNSDDQIINFTVFLDFLNETGSIIIDNQNFTDP